MKWRGQAGFTLVEVIVVAAILAILAGILVPMIFNQIDEAKIARATADTKSISTAIFVFRKDTGQWPNKGAGCIATVTLLVGNGNIPGGLADNDFDLTSQETFQNLLAEDTNGCWPLVDKTGWKGPYIPAVTADPWGNSYFVNADQFAADINPVMVYSAGPNGIVESESGAVTTAGDDIGIRIK